MCVTPHLSRMISTGSRRPGMDKSPSIFASDSRASVLRSGTGAADAANATTSASARERRRTMHPPSETFEIAHDFRQRSTKVMSGRNVECFWPKAFQQLFQLIEVVFFG